MSRTLHAVSGCRTNVSKGIRNVSGCLIDVYGGFRGYQEIAGAFQNKYSCLTSSIRIKSPDYILNRVTILKNFWHTVPRWVKTGGGRVRSIRVLYNTMNVIPGGPQLLCVSYRYCWLVRISSPSHAYFWFECLLGMKSRHQAVYARWDHDGRQRWWRSAKQRTKQQEATARWQETSSPGDFWRKKTSFTNLLPPFPGGFCIIDMDTPLAGMNISETWSLFLEAIKIYDELFLLKDQSLSKDCSTGSSIP